MSYTDIEYYLHQVDYLTPRTATEWQRLHSSHAQRYHTTRQVSQFDISFFLPLPMPSPTSCWYPQQDVQFGYSSSDPARPIPAPLFIVPMPSRVSYPRPEPNPPDGPPLYTAAQPPFQPPSSPYKTPYNVCWPYDFGMLCDSVMPNFEQNLPVAALVLQLERLTAIFKNLESRMDANECCLGNPHAVTSLTSHCRTSALLPTAAAVPSLNMPTSAPPCISDIS